MVQAHHTVNQRFVQDLAFLVKSKSALIPSSVTA
jgi:hypothetical protein